LLYTAHRGHLNSIELVEHKSYNYDYENNATPT